MVRWCGQELCHVVHEDVKGDSGGNDEWKMGLLAAKVALFSPPSPCRLLFMASKSDVCAANLEIEDARRRLAVHWAKSLDEEGNFEHTFGDPLATPCTAPTSPPPCLFLPFPMSTGLFFLRTRF